MKAITREIVVAQTEHDGEHLRSFPDTLAQRHAAIEAFSKLGASKALGRNQERSTNSFDGNFGQIAFARFGQGRQQPESLVDKAQRIIVGGAGPRLFGGELQITDRLQRIAGETVMVCQLGATNIELAAEEFLDSRGRSFMKL